MNFTHSQQITIIPNSITAVFFACSINENRLIALENPESQPVDNDEH
jgi:hypothetical protein